MNNPHPTSSKKPCDTERIQRFLESNHYRIEDNELVVHLEQCADCRRELETRAGDAQLWSDAERLLKPSEFDHAASAIYSAAGTVCEQQPQPGAVRDALACLAPTDDPNRLGRIGTYEVTAVVGFGGMGVVFKAIDPSLDRVVAIKMMAPRLANNEMARKRFAREAKAAAAVMHPNVIPIHGVSSDSSVPYLVMAFNRGSSLQKRLERDAPLPIIEVLRIGAQIAAGLAAAHEQGLVHRDIKPENILLEEGVERVAITDFGLARAIDDNTVTQHGAIAGTPMYMSPEQARGEQVDQQSDLFSLGSVLYALCTGRPPYRADSSYGVMRRIIDDSPTPIRELNSEIPEWFARIVAKLMAKDKTERFANASEVHKLLEACLSHLQQPNAFPLPNIPGLPPTVANPSWPKSQTGVFLMSLFMVVSALCAIVVSQVGGPSLTISGPKSLPNSATEGDKPISSTPSLAIETHKQEGSDGQDMAVKHRWIMKGNALANMAVRLLHIANGKSRIVSESNYQGGVTGEQDIEIELQLKSLDQSTSPPGNTIAPAMAVAMNGLQTKSQTGESFTLTGKTAGHGVSIKGDVAPLHVLMHTAYHNEELNYTPELESMLHASLQGATFLVAYIEWTPFDESQPGTQELTTDDSDPVVQALEHKLKIMQRTLANPSLFSKENKPTPEQLKIARQQVDELETTLKDLRQQITKETPQGDSLKIQGQWQVTYSEDSGRVASQDLLTDIRLTFLGEKMIIQNGEKRSEATFKLNSQTSPKSIDIVDEGKHKPGIYDLQGDTLRICVAEQLEARPTAFDSQPNSNNDVIIMLKRIANADEVQEAKPQ